MTKNDVVEIIRAQNLSVRYAAGAFTWRAANFSVNKGEFVAILGPNGAGKTTLFRLLLGLMPPTEGALKVFGEKPRRGNPRIGYVPQRHTIDSDLRIEALELVRLGLCGTRFGISSAASKKRERERAMESLRSVGAENLAHAPLGVLSGGELQRVFLAEALVSDPEVLLLDEPLSNLDIRHETNMVRLIHDVAESRNATVLLIAHNVNPLLSALDSVIYLANGNVAVGSPRDVMTSESLTNLYGAPIEVLRDSRGRLAVIGAEESPPHHHAEDSTGHTHTHDHHE
ncbi:MAG: ABC transporter ATP-binding protein [Tepidisphaeraceae bacterium]|jgi:zinc/manganese transport system ATP-binding protein